MATTHRDKLIAILQDAGIEFSDSGGDTIIVNHCEFVFYDNGRLKEVRIDGVPTAYDEFQTL